MEDLEPTGGRSAAQKTGLHRLRKTTQFKRAIDMTDDELAATHRGVSAAQKMGLRCGRIQQTLAPTARSRFTCAASNEIDAEARARFSIAMPRARPFACLHHEPLGVALPDAKVVPSQHERGDKLYCRVKTANDRAMFISRLPCAAKHRKQAVKGAEKCDWRH
jgi:hypothetical protein